MIEQIVKDNKPEQDRTNYITCPYCGVKDKFSITNFGSYILYRCFRDCHPKSRGRIDGGLRDTSYIKPVAKKSFSLPDRIVPVDNKPEVIEYLTKANALEAYLDNLVDIGYDPKLDRVVYYIRNKDTIVGAVGRALSKANVKVITYPNSAPIPFMVDNGSTLVLVEDCASACSVARLEGCTGMALLGTVFKDEYLPYILKYDRVIVALDNDAALKAIKIKKYLTLYHKYVIVRFLKKDLKDCSIEELVSLDLTPRPQEEG